MLTTQEILAKVNHALKLVQEVEKEGYTHETSIFSISYNGLLTSEAIGNLRISIIDTLKKEVA